MKPNLPQIETRLLLLVQRAQDLLPAQQLQEMAELARAGEPGIALENFCTQIYEHDVMMPPDMLEEVILLGTSLGLDSSHWEILKRSA
jgi:hypothetical protein